DALAWVVALPLFGAMLCALSGRRTARWIASGAALGTLWAAFAVAWSVRAGKPLRHAPGGWGAPLGIELRADGFAAVTLLAIGAISAIVGAQAMLDRRGSADSPGRMASLWLFAWAALNALMVSADVFNLYVALELTTFAAVALIAHTGEREAVRSALRYLFVSLTGSLAYLLGVGVLYGAYATLDLTLLGARIVPGP